MKKHILLPVLIILSLIILIFPVFAEDYLTVQGKIIENLGTEELEENEITKKVQKVTVRVLEGEYETEEYEMNYVISENDKEEKFELEKNDKVIVKLKEVDGEIESVELENIVKTNYYIYMLVIFLALIIIIGGTKSVKPILILLILIATVYFVFINNIKLGKNMIITALISELIILISTAIILNGFSKKMIINIASSIVSIAISGILMSVLGKLMKITIVIANFERNTYEVLALGAMIACTEISLAISTIISASLEEKKKEKQNIKVMELIRNGLNKGMETFTNIIGIPVIMYSCGITTILTLLGDEGINNNSIALIIAYLFSVLVGAILTIPITSLVYSLVNKNKIFYKTKSDNIIEGQRSLKL